jgi:hypothetical protein
LAVTTCEQNLGQLPVIRDLRRRHHVLAELVWVPGFSGISCVRAFYSTRPILGKHQGPQSLMMSPRRTRWWPSPAACGGYVGPKDPFEAKVVDATPQSRESGIHIGMTGREAERLLAACLVAA